MGKHKHYLRLYIAFKTKCANETIKQAKKIFEKDLCCEFELEVIDISETPELAERDNIIATPTLLLVNPDMNRMIIGDLSNTDRIISELKLNDCKLRESDLKDSDVMDKPTLENVYVKPMIPNLH